MGALADAACRPNIEISQRTFGWLGWLGVLRALNLAGGISAGLPARQAAELQAAAALPGQAATEAAQMHSWSLSREQLKSAAPLGGLPFAVLAVTEQPIGAELLTDLQHELAELTSAASFRVVSGASHESLVTDRKHAQGCRSNDCGSGRGSPRPRDLISSRAPAVPLGLELLKLQM